MTKTALIVDTRVAETSPRPIAMTGTRQPGTPDSSWQSFVFLLLLALTACGGGGGGTGGGPPPPTPDFTLGLDNGSQSVSDGNSVSVMLSATPLHGFSSVVNVQITGVPSGVSVSSATIAVTPGTPQSVNFAASANAPTSANQTVTFTGTSGTLTHSTTLTLSVTKTASNGAPGRTRYVRTDATTEYFSWINQHWIVFDPGTSRFFVTDPISGYINVLDSVSEAVVARIGVPGAYGIDETPDHKTLYVGTLYGDVYALDPSAMALTHRYVASQIGPYGFSAISALALADGRVALLGEQGGIPSVDGSSSFAIWNPTDNSIVVYGATGHTGTPLPCGVFMGAIGGFALTADRSQVLLGSIDSDGTLCEVDAATGNGNFIGSTSFGLYNLASSPDGKYIIIPGGPGAILYDPKTLNTVATVDFSNAHIPVASALAVSADSQTLFLMTDSIVYAYSLATRQYLGWLPNFFLTNTQGGGVYGPAFSPYLLAVDGTGLFAGPLEEGVGFLDTSKLQTGPVGTIFTNGYLVPATGALSGGTRTGWPDPNALGTLGNVYFGKSKATAVSAVSGLIQATTPSGSPGPADVYAFTSDGGTQILPEAFSYGPTILQVTPNLSTAEGGGTGVIVGYGFGGIGVTTVPSDLRVTIGGVAATVTSFNWNAYNLLSPPFPLQSFTYVIPPGVSGSADDVVVTDASGTATVHGAFSYLPPTQQFPLAGATLEQGIYDPHRDLYYFTDVHKIQVFSLSQKQWLSPINIAGPSGATQTLWGLALSPDGSKLVVSDATAGVLYLLDPSNPSSVKKFAVASQFGFIINPCAVAISDAGNIYFAVSAQGGTGADQFFKLDTNTGTFTDYHINSPGLGIYDLYLRNQISSDNSRVFFNDMGYVFSVDTATDKLFSATIDPSCCYGDYDLALSSNQTSFEATEYLYDTNLNAKSAYSFNDREILNTAYVYGAKLSPDGRLLFQPSLTGIDVLDGNRGNLLSRLALPITISSGYDALVADGKDSVLIAITGANSDGIAVVDLSSIPEPLASPSLGRVYSRSFPSPLATGRPNNSSTSRPQIKNLPRSARRPNTIPHVTRPFSSRARTRS